MKHLFPILLAMAVCLPAFGQYSIPTTPYTRDFLRSANAAAARIKLGVLEGSSAFLYSSTLSSGTNVYFNPGKMVFEDGQVLSYAGGTIACLNNRENFVGINLFDGSIHALRKGIDHGTFFIARVVTTNGTILSVDQSASMRLPPGRVEKFKEAVRYASHGMKLSSFGNSIMSSAYGTTTNKWMDMVFLSTATDARYLLTNMAGLSWKDYSYGGQKSREALMFLGQGVTPLLLAPTQKHSSSYIYGLESWSRLQPSGVIYGRPDGGTGPNLAVITDWFNGGRENWLHLESVIRLLRKFGTEIILTTDNEPRDSTTTIWDEYDKWIGLADAHGIAIADTRSYMEEAQRKGVTVYHDTSHPNAAGAVLYAMCVRGVLNNYQLVQDTQYGDPKGRVMALETPADLRNGTVPRWADFQTDPAVTTGARIATAITSAQYSNNIPSILMSRRTMADCVLELETGEYAIFTHPFAMSMDLVVETSNPSFSIQLMNAVDGTVQSTLTPATDTPAVKLYESLVSSVVFGASSVWSDPTGYETTNSPFRNLSVKLNCSAGSAKIIGVVWHTVPWAEVPESERVYSGVWSTGSYGDLSASPYTDTTDSSLVFTFTGNGAAMLFGAQQAGGLIDVWCDGKQIYDDLDLLDTTATTKFTKQVLVHPALTAWTSGSNKSADPGFGPHTVKVKMVGNSGSAVAASAGYRRLQVLGLYGLDTR